MKVFSWDDILKNKGCSSLAADYFARGTALTIGSFDGPHLGHLTLFKEVLNYAEKNGLISGVVTFRKPLPSFKHASSYMGDISTLDERLAVFEKLGFDFSLVIEFDEDFANIEGGIFFEILRDSMNLAFLAEGVDFKCGHKGSYGKDQIERFCLENGLKCSFLPLVKKNGERISSSKIRELLCADSVEEANELLVHE